MYYVNLATNNKMKQLIKLIIKPFIPKGIKASIRFIPPMPQLSGGYIGKICKLVNIIKFSCTHKFVYPYKSESVQISAAKQFRDVVDKIDLKNVITAPYFYPLDESVRRVIPNNTSYSASLTSDYSKVLRTDLTALRSKLSSKEDDFSNSITITIDAMSALSVKIASYYKGCNPKLALYFSRIMDSAPQSFDEALQKILFFNALHWMSHLRLVGLGRLDIILLPYLESDLKANIITLDEAKHKIAEFVKILGSHTARKSGSIIGDTGQVIFTSGVDVAGNYVENTLTHLLLEVMTELNIPDPKLIMRVNKDTSNELWMKAIECISKGNGSPLFVNETKVMNLMTQFGYDKEDVVNFGTSACWEPLIIGKSFDQNNCAENINTPKILRDFLFDNDFSSYEALETAFIKYLEDSITEITNRFKIINFDRSPISSIWIDECIDSLTDIGAGGAKYNYHGFLCAGLPNTVNSLLNIKHYVFEKSTISYSKLRDVLSANYVGFEDQRQCFIEGNEYKYGSSEQEVLSLTNKLMSSVSATIGRTTINGHKAKVGFSSPSYASLGMRTGATPDGRLNGDPFATHISPVSKDVDLAEIIDFASMLDYSGNKINGNVVDFVLSDQFVKNSDKLAQILKVAFHKGVFELQLNVLDAEKLIAAKSDPTLYPNMVVRVWGFSAYYNDLPEVYKDHLIQRAIDCAS